MRTDRLLKLAEALEANAVNPKGVKFDLNTWGEYEGTAPTIDCGTAACAFGFAALSGIFKEDGLTVSLNIEDKEIIPEYGSYSGMDAADRFFELDGWASKLFSPSYYAEERKGAEGELAVARRLRAVAENPKLLEGFPSVY